MGIVLFLSFSPLLMSLCLGFNLSSQILYYKQKAQHLCQQYNLANQKQLQKKLKTLLKLNPKAKKLRAQLNSAKNALKVAKASLIPAAIITAQATLAYVVAKQLLFFYKQQKLLHNARQLPFQVRKQLKKQLYKNFQEKNISQYSYKQIGLAVYPKPVLSLSPNYYLLPAFSYAQGSYTFFYLNIKNLLPPLLQRILPNADLFKIKCSASLIKNKKIDLTLWVY